MKKEQIQDFTIRISQSNRTQLLVILYEVLLTYMQDAMDATEYEEFKTQIRNAQQVVRELNRILCFDYEISYQLSAIYDYVNRACAMSVVKNSKAELPRLIKIIQNLYEAYKEVSGQDDSKPLMQNAQQVYAGLTYGKGTLKETFTEEQSDGSRGFLA